MLRIWGRTNSINVMKVLWCCEELELEYERTDAGMQFGIVDEPSFLAMNPNGRIPVIEDNNLILWESNAIVRYLAEKYGAGSLYPGQLAQRAQAGQWMDWQQTTLSPPLTTVFWALVREVPAQPNPAQLSATIESLDRLWSIVDQQLSEKDYIIGAQFSMADIPLGAAAWRWFSLAIERPSVPNVEAWHERLKLRTGFKNHVMLPLS